MNDLERLHNAGALTKDKLAEIRSANKGKAGRVGMAAVDRALRSVSEVNQRFTDGEKLAKADSEFWGRNA